MGMPIVYIKCFEWQGASYFVGNLALPSVASRSGAPMFFVVFLFLGVELLQRWTSEVRPPSCFSVNRGHVFSFWDLFHCL